MSVTMHAIPRHIAARTSSSALVAPSFVCPSCASSTRVPGKARQIAARPRHFSTSRTHRNAAATVAAGPPSSGYARLTSRRLISIAGVDAAKFLQGIVTASTLNRTEGFYTGFLNATGRVLHDVFIYPDTMRLGAAASESGADAFLIEVDADQADTLLKHLKRYRLRSKFKLAPVGDEQCGVWQVWDDGGSTASSPFTNNSNINTSPTTRIVLPDTRAPGLGHRLLTTVPESQLAPELEAHGLAPADDEAYRVRRYLLGVPEGQAEVPRETSLPLESNMDIMGGIDFRKGCYVGQELTIRTKHRGVVRKRILPCVLYTGEGGVPEKLEYNPGSAVSAGDTPPGTSIARDDSAAATAAEADGAAPAPVKARARSAGTFLRGVGNVGLALCRLQVMTDIELPGEAAAGGGGAAPFDPATEFVLRMDDGGSGSGSPAVKIKALGMRESSQPISRQLARLFGRLRSLEPRIGVRKVPPHPRYRGGLGSELGSLLLRLENLRPHLRSSALGLGLRPRDIGHVDVLLLLLRRQTSGLPPRGLLRRLARLDLADPALEVRLALQVRLVLVRGALPLALLGLAHEPLPLLDAPPARLGHLLPLRLGHHVLAPLPACLRPLRATTGPFPPGLLPGFQILHHPPPPVVHCHLLLLPQQARRALRVVRRPRGRVREHIPRALETLPHLRVEAIAGLVRVVLEGLLAPGAVDVGLLRRRVDPDERVEVRVRGREGARVREELGGGVRHGCEVVGRGLRREGRLLSDTGTGSGCRRICWSGPFTRMEPWCRLR
ncbi:hypothetical protein Micbo1qcDRAFT_193801 [Microdochium bolleyi]|uniref:Iron-sulfur cluster assembly factor IBA57 homolog, mitochondrial n=1 Tax=Microdochium bolleyi TaxID=196109 RepID=A0A136JBY8_9PEZI|nr:hypothetical protein Micbo1qcDRAFT_193801 [Microdochium bolleyi]